MQTFICTTSEVKCREHAEAKHPKADVVACFPHLSKWWNYHISQKGFQCKCMDPSPMFVSFKCLVSTKLMVLFLFFLKTRFNTNLLLLLWLYYEACLELLFMFFSICFCFQLCLWKRGINNNNFDTTIFQYYPTLQCLVQNSINHYALVFTESVVCCSLQL